MKSNRFYSIPYDNRNDVGIKLLRRKQGGIVAFGRWHALLGMLYDADGLLDLTDADTRDEVREELDFKGRKADESLDSFLDTCAAIGLIDLTAWQARRHVANAGVVDELEYRRGKSESGAKGGRGHKSKAENEAKTESKTKSKPESKTESKA